MPTFLTSGESRPYARLLDWDSGIERPVAHRLGSFDEVIVRDGWLCLSKSMGGVAFVPAGEPSHVHLPGTHPMPHEDPRLVWLLMADGRCHPVDRTGAAAGPAIDVADGWVVAAYGGAWLHWVPAEGSITYWSEGGPPTVFARTMLRTASGPYALLAADHELSVLDLRNGDVRPVEHAEIGRAHV